MSAPTEVADLAPILNDNRDGWSMAMDLRYARATADEVVAEWTVAPQHLQAYGIVHGGVYSGVIETLASVGAAIVAIARGQSVVGLENHTTFLHAVREGTLRCAARPLSRGRRTQVWEGNVTDGTGRTVATGRVRLICLESGSQLAGEGVGLKAKASGGGGG
jgi:1,4-dihydroxy-2-naphthoyl-CoA hydrolase